MEKSKTFLNQLAKTSAAVALIGASSVAVGAHAEEVTEPSSLTDQPLNVLSQAPSRVATPTREALEKAITAKEAEVQTTYKTALEAQKAAIDQQKVATEAKESLDKANAEVTKAEEEVTAATAIAAQATPENIAATTAKITATETKLTADKATLANAETNLTTAQTAVTTAEETLKTATEALAAVTEDIKTVETALTSPESLAAEVTKLQAEVTTADQTLETAKTSLTSTTQQIVDAATTQLTAAQTSLSAKEAELRALQSAQGTTVNTTTSVVGENKLTVPEAYYTQLSNIRGYNNLSQEAKNALITIGAQAARDSGVVGYDTPGYRPIAADMTRTVDLANLTLAQQQELSQFVAELINPVRRRFGLGDAEVTSSSLAFADAVSNAYAASRTHINHDGYAHADDILRTQATRAGLTANAWYENIGSNVIPASTMNDVKRAIYYQVVYMLFTDQTSNFGHTRTFLKGQPGEKVYLGVDTNKLGFIAGGQTYNNNSFSQHYMVAAASEVTSLATFSTTPLPGTGTTTDHSAQITNLTAEVAALRSRITALTGYKNNPSSHSAVIRAQEAVNTAQTAADTARTNLTKAQQNLATSQVASSTLTARLNTLKQAQAAAQTAVTTHQTVLADAKAHVANLKEQKTALEAQIGAQSTALQQLKDLLTKYNNPTLVADAKTKLENLKAAASSAQTAYTIAAKNLTSLVDTFKVARDAYGNKQTELAVLKNQLASLTSSLVDGLSTGSGSALSGGSSTTNGSGSASQGGNTGQTNQEQVTGAEGTGQAVATATGYTHRSQALAPHGARSTSGRATSATAKPEDKEKDGDKTPSSSTPKVETKASTTPSSLTQSSKIKAALAAEESSSSDDKGNNTLLVGAGLGALALGGVVYIGYKRYNEE